MTPATDLRDRLLALRADAMQQLVEAHHIEPAWLALIGNVGSALDALDDADMGIPITASDRLVLADDGTCIKLLFYTGPHVDGAVTLDPVRCVTLAAQLLESAGRRL